MFTLKVLYDDDELIGVMLRFDSDLISVNFDPDYLVCSRIAKVEWEDGHIGLGDSGSGCVLDWRGEFIEMFSGRCQVDGDGANIAARVKKTPEIADSLKECLNQWKSLF